ncbi:TadE family type IV pilus minor pilin [Streptomyces sp. SL13]|uniref:TadE family type IV pilus minor pilin n=1 Tax=Streptantibioticus silvisoli TaxID=2705255 RepID=A0AA90KFW2_9ACTN|nr:TadE family type IV pilus minor pilin [Streptantibioticus silvisoli]MDI5969765.1 TadE family type IV pilus minor pilin [Streptantibioticus silvisoli]
MCPSDLRLPAVARRCWRARRAGRGGTDAGYVTAETAVVLPVLVVFTAMLLWGLQAATAQIRCVDAARAGARSAARSEPASVAVAAASAAAPSGALVTVRRGGDLVWVRVRARSLGPGGLARLLSVTVGAEAAALDEGTVR